MGVRKSVDQSVLLAIGIRRPETISQKLPAKHGQILNNIITQ